MRTRGEIPGVLLTAVAALMLGAAVPAAAEVGEPPSSHFPRCDRHAKPCGEPLVLAEGRQFGGPREIVGFTSRLGPCLSFEPVPDVFGFSVCDEAANPRPKRPLRAELVGFSEEPGRRTSEIGGVLRPDVAELRVRYRRAGKARRTVAISNQLDRQLARSVGFKRRIGVFDVVVPGRVPGGRFRFKSFDSDGELIAVSRPPFG